MANWLDKYEQGGLVLKKKTKDNYGTKHNPNDVKVSVGPNFVGLGYNTKGRNYSPAWGGQFQMGGSLPGSVGFMYARTQNPAPSNGKYAKKTQASAQNGQEMKYYQDGLDFKPKSISQDGRNISKELKKEAEEKLKKMNKPKATISQYTPKASEAERLDKEKLQRIEDSYKLLNKLASSKHTTKAMENIVEPMIAMEMGVGAGKLIGKGAKALAKKAYKVNPWAEKLMNPNMGYRIADEASYQDFMSSGYVRPKSLTPEFQSKTFNNFTEAMADRPTSFPSFAKGEPAWDYLPKEGKGYIYATEQPLIRRGDINPITGTQVKGRHWAYRPIDEQTGKVITELPYDKVKVYSSEPHWLKGYQEVAKPTGTSKQLTNEEIRAYNQQLYLNHKKGLGNQGPTGAPPEGLMPYESPEYKQGGIVDPMGQWAHPGEVTTIPSNDITMKGVDYDVLGVSDTGDTKLMKPGKNYKFKGNSVTEYPKGGWLNKYK